MINGGDQYTLPYTKDIVNMPMTSSNYNLIDESIPFNQIVLHGLVGYAGKPLNLADNYRFSMLKTIETGASPYFKWFYSDSSIVKDTEYDHLYTCDYRDWVRDAQSFYNEVNDIMNDLQGHFISDHKKIADGVYKTTYDNDKSVIVNYNQSPVMVEGLLVKGSNYTVIEEEAD